MRVFVIRHAESDFNRNGLIQGSMDSKLTRLGAKQAYLLAEELKPHDLDFIFSSPASRAYLTAQSIAVPRSIPVAVVPGLREREYGIYEGKSLVETKKARPELFATGSLELNLEAKPKDGESLTQVASRVVPFIKRLKTHLKKKVIAIVAHGIVNKVIIAELTDGDLKKIGTYKQSNACINEILFEKGKGKAIRLNYTGHLESLEH
ncbi:MAG: histidine phosphatase family protein [Candidatus Micrarchaeota archaeon]